MFTLLLALQHRMTQLRDNESGAIAVEYALLIVLIAVVLAATMTSLESAIAKAFGDAIAKL